MVNHAGRGMADIGVRDGRIFAVGDLGQASAGEVFDATGLTVLPGVIDSQVHFREPGLEWKEDLETGSQCAVRGGVTAVFEMPNTEPTTTDPDALVDKLARAKGRMHCDPRLLCRRHPQQRPPSWARWNGCRLLRDQGLHGRLHRHPADRRRRGRGIGAAPYQSPRGLPTPRTNTAWSSAGRLPALATGPATRRCATPSRRSSPPSGWCGSPASWASVSMCCT